MSFQAPPRPAGQGGLNEETERSHDRRQAGVVHGHRASTDDGHGDQQGQMSAFHLTRKSALRAVVPALALLLAACAGDPTPSASISGASAPAASRPVPSVPADQATFAFEPFTGAPGNIADALSRQIGTEAREQNLRLVRRVGAPATYRINGYLSASGDQSQTTLFYVFDIVDAGGNRLHRILGQESAPGSSGDPWSGVDDTALNRAARRSVAELAAWLRR